MSDERELGPEAAAELIEAGAQVVDVREDYEYEAGHLPGAVRIELPELRERAGEIDRDRPVLFVCRGGTRSRMAADAFAEDGYDAHNVAGGALAWAESGRPLEPEGGEIVERVQLPPR